MQLTFKVCNTAIEWAIFRTTFGLKKIEKVYITWQNKGWTKVTTMKDWEKIKSQVVKQPNPEENEGFLYCLIMEIEEWQVRW